MTQIRVDARQRKRTQAAEDASATRTLASAQSDFSYLMSCNTSPCQQAEAHTSLSHNYTSAKVQISPSDKHICIACKAVE